MRAVGLPPTGTGQGVEHAILPRGPFERAVDAFLADGGRITYGDLWLDVEEGADGRRPGQGERRQRRAAKRASKTAFTCPICGAKAWARASLSLACFGPKETDPHPPAPMHAPEEGAEEAEEAAN